MEMKLKLQTYQDLLLKWQAKINLISNNTIADIWERHIEDSLQLAKFIPAGTKAIIDFGSGAGLPGIPLAIKTGIKTFLVESDKRKAVFLSEAIRATKANAVACNSRVEQCKIEITEPVVITARALADLSELFVLVEKFVANNGIKNFIMIFMKGKNVSHETKCANDIYTFDMTEHDSITNEESKILVVTNLKRK